MAAQAGLSVPTGLQVVGIGGNVGRLPAKGHHKEDGQKGHEQDDEDDHAARHARENTTRPEP